MNSKTYLYYQPPSLMDAEINNFIVLLKVLNAMKFTMEC